MTLAENQYKRPIKRKHLPPGREPLEVICLRNASLDVDLETGVVYRVRKDGSFKAAKLRPDKDGYLIFDLNRERSRIAS